MFQLRLRSISILLLALALLFSASLSVAAASHQVKTIASHCAEQTNPSNPNPQQAIDCLGHCSLPAPIANTTATLPYRQHGLSLPASSFVSIVQAPPLPPPKFSAV